MKTLTSMLVLISAFMFNAQLFAQTESAAVVSADKMNVLYIGIDNPVSIAVPGIPNDKLKVSINNGTITGSNGKYMVKVEKVTETIIEVSAEIKPGEIKKFGSSTFRVKRIPDPTPVIGNTFNNSSNTFLSKEELLKNPEITVSMNLPFDLKFEVVSFTFTYSVVRGTEKDLVSLVANGNKFTQGMIDAINKLPKDSKIYFEDIKVKGPDGSVRQLPAMVIKLMEKE
ncbi:MAG TPA: GldM family protein [Bacteroidales bacterium]|nr:GldM family protein [Bacteroidales bacterium]